MKLPLIKDLKAVLIHLEGTIRDDYGSTAFNYGLYGDAPPYPTMDVTVGADEEGNWDYQTGDNSYIGNAHGHPYWAVVILDRRSNCLELAREIQDQLAERLSVRRAESNPARRYRRA